MQQDLGFFRVKFISLEQSLYDHGYLIKIGEGSYQNSLKISLIL